MSDSKSTTSTSSSSTSSSPKTTTSAGKTPAEQRGEFNTSPDRVDPYSTTTEDEKKLARTQAEERYQRSIEGQDLPPSYEMQAEIDAEREADAKKAQEEATQPDSYQQALAAGDVGKPDTAKTTTDR